MADERAVQQLIDRLDDLLAEAIPLLGALVNKNSAAVKQTLAKLNKVLSFFFLYIGAVYVAEKGNGCGLIEVLLITWTVISSFVFLFDSLDGSPCPMLWY